MRRLALLACLLLAPAAFATGERIALTDASDAFRDTLCISMSCVNAGPREFSVTVRSVRGAMEVTVTAAGGQRRLTHVTPLNREGKISSTDLVHATSLVLQAIERGPVAQAPAPTKAKRGVASRKKSRRGSLLATR